MNNLWAEIDAINVTVLAVFEDGQPRTPAQVQVDQPADLVRRAITELTRLGYLRPGWNGTYTITLHGQGHLATQKVAV